MENKCFAHGLAWSLLQTRFDAHVSRRRWADYDFCNGSGSLTTLAAILRASSLLSNLAAERRPGSVQGGGKRRGLVIGSV
jgi:hypothetical protein